ncbi:MAG: MBL fold metallo-hydrolase [Lachnospiraceae bacterium]|nr:MBL fold metallo-hydrolase [Lachnospiraceae bacterium]
MSDWFTVEEIDTQTFVISEYQHWEEPHCYLLCGQNEAVLIDTGLGVSNIKRVVEELTVLPITVLTTHVHWDHIGGHGLFDRIAIHEVEKDWLSGSFPLPLEEVKKQITKLPGSLPEDFDAETYHIFQGEPQILLHDGDCFDLGGRTLRVLHTPGHSPGHCCFYEPERRFLYSGDLIYKGSLDAFYPTTDPLLFYLSVKRLAELDVSCVLPDHHDLEIPVSLIDEIRTDFSQIEKNGQLKQGSGLFDFGDIKIHI